MAVASWMLRSRSLRTAKTLRSRNENKDDIVKLDFNLGPSYLMQEILTNICQKHGVSSARKLNYLNAFVHLLSKNADWKSPETFGFSTEEILYCLRIALIQDSVQVRAVGLRALKYVIRTEEDVISLNKLNFPYLISRSLDLVLKSDNERVLMSERIQSLKMMRRILSVAPKHFSAILVRPLVSVVLRPIEETDRLLKANLAILCELCILNTSLFIKCDGVKALLRNATLIPSSHMAETICGALLFLLNKPSTRYSAKIDLRFLISGYTNSSVVERTSFREEERRLTWTNFVLLTLLRSFSGLFQLLNDSHCISGLKSIVQILSLNQHNVRRAIIELLFELINVPQPEWTDDETAALESVEFSRYQESFRLNEGFLVSEGKHILPTLSENRVNLTEAHTSLLLFCLLEAGLPDALVEVIVSSDTTLSLQASILLGELLHLIHNFLPSDCYTIPPSLPNLVSYVVRGCPLQISSHESISKDLAELCSRCEQYSPNFRDHFKDFHNANDSSPKIRYTSDNAKISDLRLNSTISNVPENRATKLLNNVLIVKDQSKSLVNDNTHRDFIEDSCSRISSATINLAHEKISRAKLKSTFSEEMPFGKTMNNVNELVLNINRIDFPPSKHKQRMALSALSILKNMQKIFEKPRQPASLLLKNVALYGEKNHSITVDVSDMKSKKKIRKIPTKEFEELIKDTGVLIVLEASRWKWESIRILLKLCSNNSKKMNDNNVKIMLKKLIQFFKPSSKKFSNTPVKADYNFVNIYTLVACDLIDILLDSKNNDGLKLLKEFLEDLDVQFEQIITSKSVHECLLNPQRLMNSLSQDYFLLIGRLSNNEIGLSLLQKSNVLQRLHHIATNINLDCYVKLIVSSLSYVYSDDTRKLLSSVLSCSYASSRLYATKFLQILLRTSASRQEGFRHWLVEMLINQLYDENQTVCLIALNTLSEAVDNKSYLDILVSLRPSLLHLGDKGLLLLIRFLSTEKGFSYLQAANFVTPQLQRWATSFNMKYTQIIEGELHDAMSQYQRGDDGRYRKRVTGTKMVLKDVIVPPHLYGQLTQHRQGFNLLLKHENIHKLMQVILMGNYDSDEAIMDLKSALWAVGHFATSSAGAKYLSDHGVIKLIINLAEKSNVYSIKATAFYVLSMIATTREGATALSKSRWKCLKRNNHSSYFPLNNPFATLSVEKLSDDDDSETISLPLDFESPQNDLINVFEQEEEVGLGFKMLNKLFFEKKSATLPERGGFSSQIQHNRSYSESKADASDDWSSSGSPPSNITKYISDIRSNVDQIKYRSNSCCTDSSTSGISSCDSVYGKPANYSERVPTLSPIPSTSSLTTVMANINEKEHRTFLPKRRSSISFGCRLSTQSPLSYKTLRMLQNRFQLPSPGYSASATMEYLSAHDRRQMSPLIRPKFFLYMHKPLVHDFEVKESPFHIDENEIVNVSSTFESSQFSNSTEIDENKADFNGPCYRGICLPLKLSYLLSYDSENQNSILLRKSPTLPPKSSNKADLFVESDSEQTKFEEGNNTLANTCRKRRHDKSTCLLCSMENNINNECGIVCSRKTSTSSMHRIRTETESSYGGGIGFEAGSPILLTWQQKPICLVDTTPDGASSSTLDTSKSESQNTSLISNNESSLKSRSILRKEVLKLIEQLGNPVLYKTCKQGLLQLKQICGDLFQDICLFSDVCSLLGSINYRIQARQLIHDLFLEAPFHELYDEPTNILNKTSFIDNENLTNSVGCDTLLSESCTDTKSSVPMLKESITCATKTITDDHKTNANGNLEVIIEADVLETVNNERGCSTDLGCNEDVFVENRCYLPTSSPTDKPHYDAISPKLNSPVNDTQYSSEERAKNVHICRRAYSYPDTNYVINELHLDNFISACTDRLITIPTTRSKSVSATCSYISEISLKPYHILQNRAMDDQVLSVTGSFVFKDLPEYKLKNISVFTFKHPCNVLNLDLRTRVLIKDGQPTGNEYYNADDIGKQEKEKRQNEELIVKNMTETMQRHRKIATFKSPDQNLLLKHEPNT